MPLQLVDENFHPSEWMQAQLAAIADRMETASQDEAYFVKADEMLLLVPLSGRMTEVDSDEDHRCDKCRGIFRDRLWVFSMELPVDRPGARLQVTAGLCNPCAIEEGVRPEGSVEPS